MSQSGICWFSSPNNKASEKGQTTFGAKAYLDLNLSTVEKENQRHSLPTKNEKLKEVKNLSRIKKHKK